MKNMTQEKKVSVLTKMKHKCVIMVEFDDRTSVAKTLVNKMGLNTCYLSYLTFSYCRFVFIFMHLYFLSCI